MKLFLLLIYCLLATITHVGAQAVFSRQYAIKASDGTTTTGLRLYKSDLVFVRVSGQATYGTMASMLLGRVGAAGIANAQYMALWNRPAHRREKFGAVLCRIGADTASSVPIRDDFRECLTGSFSIGVCQPVNQPVTGALFVVKSGGELAFDINDRLCVDNRGTFIVDVFILPATVPPFDSRIASTTSLLCGLIMGANQTIHSYDETALFQTVLSGKTQLHGLSEINAYYSFLNEHPTVRLAGIRWQQVAVEVSGLLLLGNQLLDQLRTSGQITDLTFLVWASYLILISEHGKTFVDGTASQGLAQHITENFYRPLIRGDFTVVDPVAFDVAAVYTEQYNPTLQAYYRSFNKYDRDLVEGSFARFYARHPGCRYIGDPSVVRKGLQISKPADRLRIGLYKMGYSAQVIQQAMLEIETLKDKGMLYPAIVERLRQRAVRMNSR